MRIYTKKNTQKIYEIKKQGTEEYEECLRAILKEHIQIESIRYFVNEALQWYRKITSGSFENRVILLGTGIPEELLMAAGTVPLRISGGSRESGQWSDDLVPRDTDPVSRSVTGYVSRLQQFRSPGELLFIIPASNDSMRKLSYQLKRSGEKVCVIDMPPDKTDPMSARKWKKEMIRMMEETADHVHGKVTSSSLYKAVRMTGRARICLHEFTIMAPEYEEVLSPAARILIQNSYSYTEDFHTWAGKLKELMREIRVFSKERRSLKKRNPRILLTGSPVYFPNIKLPELMQEAGLTIWRQADAGENIQYLIPKIGRDRRNLRKMIETVSNVWYRSDASPAYLKNEVLRRKIHSLSASGQIDGVVFHILKGQIEQDFELSYAESVLEQYRIPVFRLETDYQYQDVEQLRIRLEAFAEMLNENRQREQEAI